MTAPLVTVLIDTYNYGRYLEDAVESVLAQDFPRAEMEVIVVDDGSTDDTSERVRRFGSSIRYFRKENGGQASAFNFGFELARGRLISLLDADDVWLPQKLQRVVEQFDRNPEAGLVYHPFLEWDEASGRCQQGHFVPVSGLVPKNRSSLLNYPMSGTGTFRREALSSLLPIPTALRSQADSYLTALVIFRAPVVALPECLMKYRIHGNNFFQVSLGTQFRARIEHRIAMREVLFRQIKAWLERNGYDPRSKDLQDYLKQWLRAREADEFLLSTPSRWKYFRYLLEHPRIYGINMTPRHRQYAYLRAISALFLGYHHLNLFDGAHMTYKRLFRASLRVSGHGEKSPSKIQTM